MSLLVLAYELASYFSFCLVASYFFFIFSLELSINIKLIKKWNKVNA